MVNLAKVLNLWVTRDYGPEKLWHNFSLLWKKSALILTLYLSQYFLGSGLILHECWFLNTRVFHYESPSAQYQRPNSYPGQHNTENQAVGGGGCFHLAPQGAAEGWCLPDYTSMAL